MQDPEHRVLHHQSLKLHTKNALILPCPPEAILESPTLGKVSVFLSWQFFDMW